MSPPSRTTILASLTARTGSLLPQFSICRVYTITVLVTLLERDAMRQELDAQTVYNCDSLFSFVRSAKMRGARDCDRNTNNCPVEVKVRRVFQLQPIEYGAFRGSFGCKDVGTVP